MNAMKCTLLVIAAFFCVRAEAGDLCLYAEKNIFSFQVKSKKILSVCKGRNGDYLVYRFGKPGYVELQFPDELDKNSWEKFKFSGYRRGGGKANAGRGSYSLSFDISNVAYSVFQEWSDENDGYAIGVVVSGKTKPITIIGLKNTQEGSLVLLEGEATQLPNEAEQ